MYYSFNSYVSPCIEVSDIKVEKGFANSLVFGETGRPGAKPDFYKYEEGL